MNNQENKNQWGSLKPEHVLMIEKYLNEVANNTAVYYMLTIARDGEEPVRSIIYYDNAIEAAKVYESYQDWGFAKDFLTVTLYEPNGKIHSKVLRRSPGVESSYMRQNYIDMAEAIFKIKDLLPLEEYENFVIKVAKIFALDNKRFDELRFFENAGLDIKG